MILSSVFIGTTQESAHCPDVFSFSFLPRKVAVGSISTADAAARCTRRRPSNRASRSPSSQRPSWLSPRAQPPSCRCAGMLRCCRPAPPPQLDTVLDAVGWRALYLKYGAQRCGQERLCFQWPPGPPHHPRASSSEVPTKARIAPRRLDILSDSPRGLIRVGSSA